MKSRYCCARKWLIFWCLFIGLGAVAGSVGMFVDTSGKAMGMDAMLPFFQKLPFADIVFKDFLFSGFALLIVNGLTNLLAAFLLFKKKVAGIVLGGIFGVTLMLWICIQFYMFPLNFMSTIYFIFGLIQAVTGYACYVFYRQEHLDYNKDSYKNISDKSDTLVVYFSRLGATKKIAYEYADKLNAEIFEIKADELTEGTKGFWWCGRFGMHRWGMKLKSVPENIESYKNVVICTPVWVFSVSSPIREFLKLNSGKLNNVTYVAVHFNPWLPKSLFNEMDELSGSKHIKSVSVRNKYGKIKYLN